MLSLVYLSNSNLVEFQHKHHSQTDPNGWRDEKNPDKKEKKQLFPKRLIQFPDCMAASYDLFVCLYRQPAEAAAAYDDTHSKIEDRERKKMGEAALRNGWMNRKRAQNC